MSPFGQQDCLESMLVNLEVPEKGIRPIGGQQGFVVIQLPGPIFRLFELPLGNALIGLSENPAVPL
ncbi:MAG: hypothetical protein KDA77_21680 [Planctomycetaceae bacterium]|nr:hypothetical protein [Planctomycetaceae bacterium]